MSKSTIIRTRLFVTTALLLVAGAARAADAVAAEASAATDVSEVVVTMARETRSSVEMSTQEIQKVLPGISPLKAISTMPGVVFETADPWGNNEQNESLLVHGFTQQQLGFTMDGVPLGDQQYGNYNGLSVSRALTSENVDRVILSSGAAELGVASTSNLGGAIQTYSRDPSQERVFNVRQTVGSYQTTRTFLRADIGAFGDGNSAYISYLHHDAKAWDFNGHQRGDQVNLKFVHEGPHGKLTAYADWQSKFEPNEDATAFGNQQTAAAAGFTPYTRPFLYPNLGACTSNLTGGVGTPPVAQGNNFSNCFSAAQRADALAHLKYDWKLADKLTWSNQVYYHYDYGRGIVAGPINTGGLPALFAAYYPQLVVGTATSAGTLTNINTVFGGLGNAVRTTEYRINRSGGLSTLDGQWGDHHVEAGIWFEHNEPAQHRVWYPFAASSNDLSPYDIPDKKAFTQYYAEFFTNDIQIHLQDQWRITPTLLLQAGVKSSLQNAKGKFPINQQNLATANPPVHYPSGTINSNEWFLPQAGAIWDATEHEQVFVNVQKNLRQFVPYGAGGNFYATAPWSLGTQAAFELFKQTVKPESSVTYEVGTRTHRDLGGGVGLQGQISLYHTDFSNRAFNIAPYNFINPAPSIIVNVGGVKTNGIDVAGTLTFGEHFHVYDAISYNKSEYKSNYNSGFTTVGGVQVPTVVAIAGKEVPLSPNWLNKFIAGMNFGPFEAQVSGDYVGRRYASYLNDQQVKATFVMGLEASYMLPATFDWVHSAKISVNITNLADTKGVSTINVTGPSGGYQAFPLSPRMFFLTLSGDF